MSQHDPFTLFRNWLADAEKSEPNDPNAMSLATVGEDGMPSVRMVLLKGFDEAGFVFYTNLASQKGRELAAHPKAALCFHWKTLKRQVRVEGLVTPVSEAEADAYFASRARDSRIGAWASKQSQAMQGRFELEQRVARYALKFNIGTIPRPPFWSGYRISPQKIEFWRDKPFRLHERSLYVRQADGGWATATLFP
ncbi:MAG: pyridoxamine 5'-phosphate oxidase [Uliginosibacterium sp.]|nr:pyridoxamine 5'-phosphate oxidase [Uliginosibacterium sp.]